MDDCDRRKCKINIVNVVHILMTISRTHDVEGNEYDKIFTGNQQDKNTQ